MKIDICNFCVKTNKVYRCRMSNISGVFYACKDCIEKLLLIPMETIYEENKRNEEED